MTDPIWIGGVFLSLWLGYASLFVRRWWPAFWVAAVFWGAATGMLFAVQHSAMTPVWWSLWFAYTFVLPIMRWIRGARA